MYTAQNSHRHTHALSLQQ